ncbi:MAG: diaminopimelate epimerase, partial [Bacteroidetes bacterium]
MIIPFFKYQGTGNDFVLLDQRIHTYVKPSDTELIRHLCDRRFGVGADGLIFLKNHPEFDFEMVYFNADGRQSTMCGNGGRCIAAFAQHLGLVSDKCRFLAIDGEHEAIIHPGNEIELKMGTVGHIQTGANHFILDTGSPHYVVFVEDLDDLNVVESAKMIRYSAPFRKEGINVNFVQPENGQLKIATYERGVEDETLSCGTGVTAAALAWHFKNNGNAPSEIPVRAKGGFLKVRFTPHPSGEYRDIWLCGKAELVFEGRFLQTSSSVPDLIGHEKQ